ncbi:hypothetical protein BC332_28297 [Capsicum chinense]|nr:hypothetical protein BC332_28297 [Capsicum chinense]
MVEDSPSLLLWTIWEERNQRIFEGKESTIQKIKWKVITSPGFWLKNSVEEIQLVDFIGSLQPAKEKAPIASNKPPEDFSYLSRGRKNNSDDLNNGSKRVGPVRNSLTRPGEPDSLKIIGKDIDHVNRRSSKPADRISMPVGQAQVLSSRFTDLPEMKKHLKAEAVWAGSEVQNSVINAQNDDIWADVFVDKFKIREVEDEPQPLAILEGDQKLSKWEEEKYIDFGKLLGVSIEEMKDKVIDFLCCIDHEARGNAKEVVEKIGYLLKHEWGDGVQKQNEMDSGEFEGRGRGMVLLTLLNIFFNL